MDLAELAILIGNVQTGVKNIEDEQKESKADIKALRLTVETILPQVALKTELKEHKQEDILKSHKMPWGKFLLSVTGIAALIKSGQYIWEFVSKHVNL